MRLRFASAGDGFLEVDVSASTELLEVSASAGVFVVVASGFRSLDALACCCACATRPAFVVGPKGLYSLYPDRRHFSRRLTQLADRPIASAISRWLALKAFCARASASAASRRKLSPASIAALARLSSSAFVDPFVTVGFTRGAMPARAEASGLRPEYRPRRRHLHRRYCLEHHGMTFDRSVQPVQLRDRSRSPQAAPVERLLAEHPQCVAICLRSFSTIADDPEPRCRCSGIDHRAWRTHIRQKFVPCRGSKFSKFSGSSAHSAGLALGAIGTRAARRAHDATAATRCRLGFIRLRRRVVRQARVKRGERVG